MAGEKKGKTYEAIIFLALRQAVGKRKTHLVKWNETPESMCIEPDFTIGDDPNSPDQVILVTHSGSAKESEKKFWRNIGELAEAKVLLPKPPAVFSIVFDAVMKKDLQTVQSKAFDGQLVIDSEAYGAEIIEWASRNARDLPAGADERLDFVQAGLSQKTVTRLSKDLKSLLAKRSDILEGLWTRERSRVNSSPIQVQDTWLRHGIGKLILLRSMGCTVNRAGAISPKASEINEETIVKLGFGRRTLKGVRISDPAILWVVQNFSQLAIDEICQDQPVDRLDVWIGPLTELGAITFQVEYCEQNWQSFLDASALHSEFLKCKDDPAHVFPSGTQFESNRVWLFHLLTEWIKIAGETRTSFGNAALMRDLTSLKSDPEHRKTVESISGVSPEWRSGDTIRLGLQDWYNVASEQRFPLHNDDLARVSDVFARRLRTCRPIRLDEDIEEIEKSIIQSNLNTKLLTYWLLQPVESVLKLVCNEANIEYERLQHLPSCFAAAVRSDGTVLDSRSTGTTVYSAGCSLVAWQTVTSAGRDHKKKEISGRGPALRYEWDPESRDFRQRDWVKNMVLIVDGSWRQSDIDSMIAGGWDHIVYPHETERLKSILVGGA